nr:EF-Hand 1, calcium-binding site-containing protein [Tanacetum cinerariifolium]
GRLDGVSSVRFMEAKCSPCYYFYQSQYIEQGKPLGGLLLLLPQILRPEKSDTVGGHDDTSDKENLKKQLVDLDQKLIHATINYPVYFAFEDEDLDKVLADIKRNDAAGQPATATTGGILRSRSDLRSRSYKDENDP